MLNKPVLRCRKLNKSKFSVRPKFFWHTSSQVIRKIYKIFFVVFYSKKENDRSYIVVSEANIGINSKGLDLGAPSSTYS